MSTVASDELNRLQRLYEAGLQDPFVDNALRKVVDHQTSRSEADLQRVKEVLIEFEHRYGFTSDDFWHRYQNGELDDTADFMEWNIYCKMRQRILARLSILRDNGTRSTGE